MMLYVPVNTFSVRPFFLCKTSTKQTQSNVAQLVTCLATDVYLTSDPGVGSSIPAQSHTYAEINHEIIF